MIARLNFETESKQDKREFKPALPDLKPEFKKYIVYFSERSTGEACNHDYVRLVESPVVPTKELLQECGLMPYQGCINQSCLAQDCKGSIIVGFRVEDYSPELANQQGLVDKLFGSEPGSCFDTHLHRIMPKNNPSK